MRGPEDAPVGVLRRVLILSVVRSNSVSRISPIIGGMPGHLRTAVIPGTPGTSR